MSFFMSLDCRTPNPEGSDPTPPSPITSHSSRQCVWEATAARESRPRGKSDKVRATGTVGHDYQDHRDSDIKKPCNLQQTQIVTLWKLFGL